MSAKWFRGVPIRRFDALLQQERRIRARWSMPPMPVWLLQLLSLACWILLGGGVSLMILMLK